MLPIDTVQALTMAIAHEILSADAPTVLVVHDGPAPDALSPTDYVLRVYHLPIRDLGTWQAGLPGLLADLLHTILTRTTDPRLRDLTRAVTRTVPGAHRVAVGVRYSDLATVDNQITVVERVDAVDIDGRVYQAVRAEGSDPVIAVDNQPNPRDLPATHPGLAAILATTPDRESTEDA